MKIQVLVIEDDHDAQWLLQHWLQEPPATYTAAIAQKPATMQADGVQANSELTDWETLLGHLRQHQCLLLVPTPAAPPVAKAGPVPPACVQRLLPPAAGPPGRPDAKTAQPGPATAPDHWLHQLWAALEKSLDNPLLTVDYLADQLAMSRKGLLRKVQALLQVAPKELIQHYRLFRAAQLLAAGYRVAEVADRVGFGSATYFGQCFKERYHTTPGKYAAAHGAPLAPPTS